MPRALGPTAAVVVLILTLTRRQKRRPCSNDRLQTNAVVEEHHSARKINYLKLSWGEVSVPPVEGTFVGRDGTTTVPDGIILNNT